MTHIYLAFQKGRRRRVEWLTRFVTQSVYCHVEIFESDGPAIVGQRYTMWSSDSWTGCVRSRREVYDPDFWDIVHVPWAPEDAIRRIERLEGAPYDMKALFLTQFLNLRRSNPGQFICTAICGEGLGLTRPERYSPQELKDAVEDMNRVHAAALAQAALAAREAAARAPRRARPGRPRRPAHVSPAAPARVRLAAGGPGRPRAVRARAAVREAVAAGVPAPPPP